MTRNDDERREKIAETILRQGELKLGAQLSLATSADLRAAALAAIFSAVAVALFGGAAAIVFSDNPDLKLAIGAGVSGLLYGVGAYLCALACQPTDFYTVGNQPQKWLNDTAMDKEPVDAFLREAQNYQIGILANRQAIRRNGERLKWALRIAWASPFIGLSFLVFLVLYEAAQSYFGASV